MLRISFEGKSVQDLVGQMQDLCDSLTAKDRPQPRILRSTSEVANLREETAKKRGPGRPPKASKNTSESMDLAEDISENPQEMVRATGIEPVVNITPSEAPAKVTKEAITTLLQELMSKESASGGGDTAGINAVRDVLSRFGVKRLGELDVKKYVEFRQYVQDAIDL